MKLLNAFGILVALLLSIGLVVMLIAAPLMLSTLSVLEPKNIVDVMVKGLTEEMESAAAEPQKAYTFEKLSKSSKEKSLTESIMDVLEQEGLKEIGGQKIDEEVVAKVLASDAMVDIFEAYAEDVANALIGESGKKQFTAKNVKKIVHDNLDEIVEAVEDAGIKMSKSERAEAKEKIDSAVKKNADKFVNTLPDPEEIGEVVINDEDLSEIVGEFLAQRAMLKTTIVVTVIVMSVLIFFLRYPGFRGLRWLSTDLFIAGAFNVLFCIGLGIGLSAAKDLAGEVDNSMAEGIIKSFIDQLSTGVIVRTAIMLVAAIALLVGYYLLKKVARKKSGKEAENVIVMPSITPVFTPAPAPAPVAAPVYTAVTVAPELVDETTPELAEDPALAETKAFVAEPAEEPAMAETEVFVPETAEETVQAENEA